MRPGAPPAVTGAARWQRRCRRPPAAAARAFLAALLTAALPCPCAPATAIPQCVDSVAVDYPYALPTPSPAWSCDQPTLPQTCTAACAPGFSAPPLRCTSRSVTQDCILANGTWAPSGPGAPCAPAINPCILGSNGTYVFPVNSTCNATLAPPDRNATAVACRPSYGPCQDFPMQDRAYVTNALWDASSSTYRVTLSCRLGWYGGKDNPGDCPVPGTGWTTPLQCDGCVEPQAPANFGYAKTPEPGYALFTCFAGFVGVEFKTVCDAEALTQTWRVYGASTTAPYDRSTPPTACYPCPQPPPLPSYAANVSAAIGPQTRRPYTLAVGCRPGAYGRAFNSSCRVPDSITIENYADAATLTSDAAWSPAPSSLVCASCATAPSRGGVLLSPLTTAPDGVVTARFGCAPGYYLPSTTYDATCQTNVPASGVAPDGTLYPWTPEPCMPCVPANTVNLLAQNISLIPAVGRPGVALAVCNTGLYAPSFVGSPEWRCNTTTGVWSGPALPCVIVPSPSPTPTPSRTPSRSATATSSRTPSVTPSISGSPSVTRSTSGSPSVTPSSSASRSVTKTSSATASLTPTSSGTASATSTASMTISPSESPSVTPGLSVTITPSPSRSASSSLTPSHTSTRSSTTSKTASATASASPTTTGTVTPTRTGSATASATRTRSITPTNSLSASRTGTPSVTPSEASQSPLDPNESPSPSRSIKPTPSSSSSITGSASPTASATASSTATSTASVSLTVGWSLTPSRSVSPSLTGSATLTQSTTPSRSVSPTGSATPTQSCSVSPTASRTVTPSMTASSTNSPSPTRSVQPVPSLCAAGLPPLAVGTWDCAYVSASPSPSAGPGTSAGGSLLATLSPLPPTGVCTLLCPAGYVPEGPPTFVCGEQICSSPCTAVNVTTAVAASPAVNATGTSLPSSPSNVTTCECRRGGAASSCGGACGGSCGFDPLTGAFFDTCGRYNYSASACGVSACPYSRSAGHATRCVPDRCGWYPTTNGSLFTLTRVPPVLAGGGGWSGRYEGNLSCSTGYYPSAVGGAVMSVSCDPAAANPAWTPLVQCLPCVPPPPSNESRLPELTSVHDGAPPYLAVYQCREGYYGSTQIRSTCLSDATEPPARAAAGGAAGRGLWAPDPSTIQLTCKPCEPPPVPQYAKLVQLENRNGRPYFASFQCLKGFYGPATQAVCSAVSAVPDWAQYGSYAPLCRACPSQADKSVNISVVEAGELVPNGASEPPPYRLSGTCNEGHYNLGGSNALEATCTTVTTSSSPWTSNIVCTGCEIFTAVHPSFPFVVDELVWSATGSVRLKARVSCRYPGTYCANCGPWMPEAIDVFGAPVDPATPPESVFIFAYNSSCNTTAGGFWPAVTPECLPLPSPTPSRSVTPSVTPSTSPSRSITPSVTVSCTPSTSVTSSPSPSTSVSPSITPSTTVSASHSPSTSASPSASNSASTSSSPSPTVSPSFGASLSPSRSITATTSGSPSVTSSYTPSTSPSSSVTPSGTPSSTETPSTTPSNSGSGSVTPSATATPSSSSSGSPSSSASSSASATPSSTRTPSSTVTPTPSSTVTPSSTRTPSQTPSSSGSPTGSPSSSPLPASLCGGGVVHTLAVCPPFSLPSPALTAAKLGGVDVSDAAEAADAESRWLAPPVVTCFSREAVAAAAAAAAGTVARPTVPPRKVAIAGAGSLFSSSFPRSAASWFRANVAGDVCILSCGEGGPPSLQWLLNGAGSAGVSRLAPGAPLQPALPWGTPAFVCDTDGMWRPATVAPAGANATATALLPATTAASASSAPSSSPPMLVKPACDAATAPAAAILPAGFSCLSIAPAPPAAPAASLCLPADVAGPSLDGATALAQEAALSFAPSPAFPWEDAVAAAGVDAALASLLGASTDASNATAAAYALPETSAATVTESQLRDLLVAARFPGTAYCLSLTPPADEPPTDAACTPLVPESSAARAASSVTGSIFPAALLPPQPLQAALEAAAAGAAPLPADAVAEAAVPLQLRAAATGPAVALVAAAAAAQSPRVFSWTLPPPVWSLPGNVTLLLVGAGADANATAGRAACSRLAPRVVVPPPAALEEEPPATAATAGAAGNASIAAPARLLLSDGLPAVTFNVTLVLREQASATVTLTSSSGGGTSVTPPAPSAPPASLLREVRVACVPLAKPAAVKAALAAATLPPPDASTRVSLVNAKPVLAATELTLEESTVTLPFADNATASAGVTTITRRQRRGTVTLTATVGFDPNGLYPPSLRRVYIVCRADGGAGVGSASVTVEALVLRTAWPFVSDAVTEVPATGDLRSSWSTDVAEPPDVLGVPLPGWVPRSKLVAPLPTHRDIFTDVRVTGFAFSAVRAAAKPAAADKPFSVLIAGEVNVTLLADASQWYNGAALIGPFKVNTRVYVGVADGSTAPTEGRLFRRPAIRANVSFVSPDGYLLRFTAPPYELVCPASAAAIARRAQSGGGASSSSNSADCGFTPIYVVTPHTPAFTPGVLRSLATDTADAGFLETKYLFERLGAAVSCPPFCPGAYGGMVPRVTVLPSSLRNGSDGSGAALVQPEGGSGWLVPAVVGPGGAGIETRARVPVSAGANSVSSGARALAPSPSGKASRVSAASLGGTVARGGGSASSSSSSSPFLTSSGAPVPVDTVVAKAGGLYYVASCSAYGYIDPSTGACTQEEDPRSYRCALGSGSTQCLPCPPGGLCPGGWRVWARRGWWSPTETLLEPVACPYPARARCLGWDAAAGRTICGRGYDPSSWACSRCLAGYRETADGACEPCAVSPQNWLEALGAPAAALAAALVYMVAVAALARQRYLAALSGAPGLLKVPRRPWALVLRRAAGFGFAAGLSLVFVAGVGRTIQDRAPGLVRSTLRTASLDFFADQLLLGATLSADLCSGGRLTGTVGPFTGHAVRLSLLLAAAVATVAAVVAQRAAWGRRSGQQLDMPPRPSPSSSSPSSVLRLPRRCWNVCIGSVCCGGTGVWSRAARRARRNVTGWRGQTAALGCYLALYASGAGSVFPPLTGCETRFLMAWEYAGPLGGDGTALVEGVEAGGANNPWVQPLTDDAGPGVVCPFLLEAASSGSSGALGAAWHRCLQQGLTECARSPAAAAAAGSSFPLDPSCVDGRYPFLMEAVKVRVIPAFAGSPLCGEGQHGNVAALAAAVLAVALVAAPLALVPLVRSALDRAMTAPKAASAGAALAAAWAAARAREAAEMRALIEGGESDEGAAQGRRRRGGCGLALRRFVVHVLYSPAPAPMHAFDAVPGGTAITTPSSSSSSTTTAVTHALPSCGCVPPGAASSGLEAVATSPALTDLNPSLRTTRGPLRLLTGLEYRASAFWMRLLDLACWLVLAGLLVVRPSAPAETSVSAAKAAAAAAAPPPAPGSGNAVTVFVDPPQLPTAGATTKLLVCALVLAANALALWGARPYLALLPGGALFRSPPAVKPRGNSSSGSDAAASTKSSKSAAPASSVLPLPTLTLSLLRRAFGTSNPAVVLGRIPRPRALASHVTLYHPTSASSSAPASTPAARLAALRAAARAWVAAAPLRARLSITAAASAGGVTAATPGVAGVRTLPPAPVCWWALRSPWRWHKRLRSACLAAAAVLAAANFAYDLQTDSALAATDTPFEAHSGAARGAALASLACIAALALFCAYAYTRYMLECGALDAAAALASAVEGAASLRAAGGHGSGGRSDAGTTVVSPLGHATVAQLLLAARATPRRGAPGTSGSSGLQPRAAFAPLAAAPSSTVRSLLFTAASRGGAAASPAVRSVGSPAAFAALHAPSSSSSAPPAPTNPLRLSDIGRTRGAGRAAAALLRMQALAGGAGVAAAAATGGAAAAGPATGHHAGQRHHSLLADLLAPSLTSPSWTPPVLPPSWEAPAGKKKAASSKDAGAVAEAEGAESKDDDEEEAEGSEAAVEQDEEAGGEDNDQRGDEAADEYGAEAVEEEGGGDDDDEEWGGETEEDEEEDAAAAPAPAPAPAAAAARPLASLPSLYDFHAQAGTAKGAAARAGFAGSSVGGGGGRGRADFSSRGIAPTSAAKTVAVPVVSFFRKAAPLSSAAPAPLIAGGAVGGGSLSATGARRGSDDWSDSDDGGGSDGGADGRVAASTNPLHAPAATAAAPALLTKTMSLNSAASSTGAAAAAVAMAAPYATASSRAMLLGRGPSKGPTASAATAPAPMHSYAGVSQPRRRVAAPKGDDDWGSSSSEEEVADEEEENEADASAPAPAPATTVVVAGLSDSDAATNSDDDSDGDTWGGGSLARRSIFGGLAPSLPAPRLPPPAAAAAAAGGTTPGLTALLKPGGIGAARGGIVSSVAALQAVEPVKTGFAAVPARGSVAWRPPSTAAAPVVVAAPARAAVTLGPPVSYSATAARPAAVSLPVTAGVSPLLGRPTAVSSSAMAVRQQPLPRWGKAWGDSDSSTDDGDGSEDDFRW